MIYQSEDLFLHDEAWKDDVVTRFRNPMVRQKLCDECLGDSLKQTHFFYSFCHQEHFQNQHHLLTPLLIYTNIEHQRQQGVIEQPFIVFFDQQLNDSGQQQTEQLVWDALSYVHQSDPCTWPAYLSKHPMNPHHYYFYFNGVALSIQLVNCADIIQQPNNQLILIIQKTSIQQYNQNQIMKKVS